MSKLSIRLFLPLIILSPLRVYSQIDCPPLDSFGKAIFPIAEERMKDRFPEIRRSLPTLSEYTDREISMIMSSMGDNLSLIHI